MPSRQASPLKRHRDRDSTQRDILEVATSEFAQHGFDGGRVDEIAARTRTTKRMIYYYFGSKEELYITVLKRAYVTIREAEQELDVDESDPKAAIRRLAELTFDHHESHPDFIRLVSIENIAHGAHMTKGTFGDLNNPVIELIGKILARGYDEGVFHRRIDPLDLHLMMSSFSYFRVANRYTFTAVFDRDPLQSERRAGYRRMLGDMVVDYLTGSNDSTA